MKIILIPVLFSFLMITSCNEKNHVENLQKEMILLRAENDSLIKQFEQQELQKVSNSQLYLIPSRLFLSANKSNTIEGVLSEIQDYPDFELYYADENNNYNEKDKINFRKTDKNRFEFNYVPTVRNGEQEIRVVSVSKINGSKIVLYGITYLPVE